MHASRVFLSRRPCRARGRLKFNRSRTTPHQLVDIFTSLDNHIIDTAVNDNLSSLRLGVQVSRYAQAQTRVFRAHRGDRASASGTELEQIHPNAETFKPEGKGQSGRYAWRRCREGGCNWADGPLQLGGWSTLVVCSTEYVTSPSLAHA